MSEFCTDEPTETRLKDLLARGIRLHQQGDLAQAEACYQEILAQAPEFPEALNFLGVLTHQKGMSTAAIDLIAEAIRLAPGYFDAYANAGKISLELGLYEQAEKVFVKALELMPGQAGAERGLAMARRQLQAGLERLAELQRAVDEMPDDPKLHFELGLELRCQARLDEAERAFLRTLEIAPGAREAYYQLSEIFYTTDQREVLLALLEQWLERMPDDPYARHMLNSMTGQHVQERASDDYVREAFDKFADSFDQVLHTLDYRTPHMIGETVARLAQGSGGFKEGLDAGCGTGLCGPLLKPHVGRLAGVDLSRKMLAKAELRGCYDELVQGELTEFIASRKDWYDLIVSADTLIYFGDLRPVSQAIAQALRPGGRCLFTVEKLEDPNFRGYVLNGHGRYSHCLDYVSAILADAGFAIDAIEATTLRQEENKAVDGLFISVSKPSP